jgi:hypothetical protein
MSVTKSAKVAVNSAQSTVEESQRKTVTSTERDAEENESFKLSKHGPYTDNGPVFGISMRRASRKVAYLEPLSNFLAYIERDVVEDDGVERSHVFEMVAGVSPSQLIKRFQISAEEFGEMRWPVAKIGPEAIVMAGLGKRDHLRAAIQFLSTNIQRRRLFTHTGWRKLKGHWFYLHGGGAIGGDGLHDSVRVRLSPSLTPFQLPHPPTGARLRKAIRASLRMLDVAPSRITIPLHAAIWRSVLGGADFGVHVTGPTGVFKTALVALPQQHFGTGFDALHLPASWSSTANANAALQFILKDALLVVDDFVGQGSEADVARAHRDAERIFRGQANQAGRARLARDGMTLRDSKPPRCLTLSTGETVPNGQSVQARIWVIEVGPGDVNVETLTTCQRDAEAGLYADAMSGFLRWAAPQLEEHRNRFQSWAAYLRREATQNSGQHRRSPGQMANLQAAFELFLTFARESGAITTAEWVQRSRESWHVLTEEAERATAEQAEQDPCRLFLALLRAAITSGTHVLGSATTGKPRETDPNKVRPLIGWYSSRGEFLLLEPEAAFAAAQRMAAEQKRTIPLGPKTLYKRMAQGNLLALHDEGRTTKKWQIGTARQRVICLRREDVLGEDTGEEEEEEGME